MMEGTSEVQLSVATEEAPTYRVYIKAGTFSRSPSRLEILEGIKGAVLEGAGKVSEGLIEACKSKAIDLAIVYCAGGGHRHHTIRVAAHDGLKFLATLHINDDGNIVDQLFDNGGRKGKRDFERGLFEVI